MESIIVNILVYTLWYYYITITFFPPFTQRLLQKLRCTYTKICPNTVHTQHTGP